MDAFTKDREFDRFLSKLGMNQLALGVEGVSQRLRNRLLKGITEEEIFHACRIAIDTEGFNKIKFFMLANVDEDWKDYEEFFFLLDKVVQYRDLMDKKLLVKVSWTPIFIEPCTPLQWKKPTIDQRQPWQRIKDELDRFNVLNDEGRVVKWNVKYPQGGGGKFEENFLYVMQGMHLGDTRFAEAVVGATEELDRTFYTAFPKTVKNEKTGKIKLGMKDTITKWMKKVDFSWGYIMRERYSNEIFPWDIVDRGVPKSSLLKMYLGIKSGQFDERKIRIKPKMEAGVLDAPENNEQSYVRWHRVIYRVRGDYQMVPNSHFKAIFHRAAYLCDFPLSVNQMIFLSDRDNKNWYGGYDYFFMATQREISDHEFQSLNDLSAKKPFKNVRI
ncbi:hypothetical protein ES703_63353 [subsurface metagenome]